MIKGDFQIALVCLHGWSSDNCIFSTYYSFRFQYYRLQRTFNNFSKNQFTGNLSGKNNIIVQLCNIVN